MEIHFATGNTGKVEDARAILGEEFDVKQLRVDVMEPGIEDIGEISREKVRQAVEISGVEGPVFADDSGLFVVELDGFPGPHTAYFERTVGKEKLLKLLDGESARAEFRAAIALFLPGSGDIEVFRGSCAGKVVEPRGNGGFGYDPMFLPEGHGKTFAEDLEYKHRVSHRKEALDKLGDRLKDLS